MLGLPPLYRDDLASKAHSLGAPTSSTPAYNGGGSVYNRGSMPVGLGGATGGQQISASGAISPPGAALQQQGSIIAASSTPSTPAEAWVQRQLPFYEDRYTTLHKATMLVTTFNVACKPPPSREYLQLLVQRELLGKASYYGAENQQQGATGGSPSEATDAASPSGEGSNNAAAPTSSAAAAQQQQRNITPMDFIVVGLQEVDMSASALWKEETETAQPWIQGFKAAVGADSDSNFNPNNQYYMLPPKQLVGLLMLFFVRKPLGQHIEGFGITSVATGAMSTLGNKGCVAMRFQMHKSSYCIINAHLAAGQEHTAKRNDDMHTILTQLDFNSSKNAPSGYQNAYGYRPLMAQDHDLVVLLGDLNYRVDIPYAEGIAKAVEGDYEHLLRRDQLLKELANPHTSFRGFTDHTPTRFPPTYRFDIGTHNYDTSEKKRIPAYTDRILHWSKNQRHRSVYLLANDVKRDIMSSDHKPYCCVLSIPYREEVPALKRQVEEELRAKVSTAASLDRVAAAKISVDVTNLDFGLCTHYTERKEMFVTFKNEGECVAVVNTARATARATGSGSSGAGGDVMGGGANSSTQDVSGGMWIRCRPLNFEILPGESRTVSVECYLNRMSLTWTNRWEPFTGQSEKSLKSMLLFTVENGPLSAVECSVRVKASVFCNSLGNLLKLGNTPCAEAYAMGAAAGSSHNLVSTPTTASGPLGGSSVATSNGTPTTTTGASSVYAPGTPAAENERLLAALPRIPKEIWYLCEAILKRASTEKELFTTDTEWQDVASVMEYLDTHAEPIPANVGSSYALAQCLIDLLKNLQEPVIPFAMYKAALSVTKSGGKVPLYFVHEQLPAAHCNLFIYLIGFLRRLLLPSFTRFNELDASTLAQIFSKIFLIRPNPNGGGADGGAALGANGLPAALPELRAMIQQEQLDAGRFMMYFLAGTTGTVK